MVAIEAEYELLTGGLLERAQNLKAQLCSQAFPKRIQSSTSKHHLGTDSASSKMVRVVNPIVRR